MQLSNKIVRLFENKYFKAATCLIIIVGFFVPAFFYLFNYGYLPWLGFLFAPILLLILTLFIFIGSRNTFSADYWQSVFKRLFNNIKFEISTARVILYAFFVSIIIANIFLFDFVFSERISVDSAIDFLFYETNIWLHISSLFVFYSIFIIFLWSWGEKILALIKIRPESRLESFLLSLSLGLIPLMFGVLLLAFLGLLYAPAVWLLVLLFGILSTKQIIDNIKFLVKKKFRVYIDAPRNTFKILVLLALFVLLCFSFVINIKPFPITTDDLHTYYNAPALYATYHEFRPLYHHATANMGQNTEMIYAAIISAISTKYIIHLQLLFLVLTALGFYAFIKNLFGPDRAFLGTLFILFIPWNPYYFSTVKVEFFLAFYSIITLLLLYHWHRERNNVWLYLFGALSGVAMGIKYSAVLLILPQLALILFFLLKGKQPKKVVLKEYIIMLFLFFLFFSPWAIKNQIYFKNVFYPREVPGLLANHNPNGLDYNKEFKKAKNIEINYLRHAQTGNKYLPRNIVTSLWRQSTGHKIDRGAWINFGFLPFAALALGLMITRRKKVCLILGLLFFYFALWYCLEGARPWYAFFGIMAVTAFVPAVFWKYKKMLGFVLVLTFFSFLVNTFVLTPNIKYLLGAIDEREYREVTIPYSDLADYINYELHPALDEKILIVKDFRVAFINNNDQLVLVDQYFDKINFALHQGSDEFKRYLSKHSIAYIVDSKVNERNFTVWLQKHSISQDEYLQNYIGRAPSIYGDFQVMSDFLQNQTELLYNDDGYSLYKIKY
ncbi:glycosyltransferase family 39 protein [Candidatus Parcubacteria bacterium]|nr:glycosyltransferase family 39 protein [Candidatus Parcubacteria bacterium]